MRIIKLRKGFTLLEIMISIVIIGILTTIVLPQMVKGRYKAQFTSCQFNVRSLGSALENYYTDHQKYPDTLKPIFEPTSGPPYIQPEPHCPSDNSTYGYEVIGTEGNNYCVWCQSKLHVKLLGTITELGFPQFSPTDGLRSRSVD